MRSRSINLGSFLKTGALLLLQLSFGLCMRNFLESWVKSNHFAAGALLCADYSQILSNLTNFGPCGPFTRNVIPKE